MAEPTPDQVQIANEVLAGTRQINSSSMADPPPPPGLSEDAKHQAMSVVTPEVREQITRVETMGAESRSIHSLPDPYDAKAIETFQQQKKEEIKQEISGPGE